MVLAQPCNTPPPPPGLSRRYRPLIYCVGCMRTATVACQLHHPPVHIKINNHSVDGGDGPYPYP
jgi:hypothetical protein